MAAIERRLAKLEDKRDKLQALGKQQELRIVRVDKVDLEGEIPVLVIRPGMLDLLRPNGSGYAGEPGRWVQGEA